MTTRPIHTTPMMRLNSPRPTRGNTDPLNNHILPPPSMCPTIHPNPITTPPTVLPLMLFHIRRPLSGTGRLGPSSSVNRWHHRHPSQRHPSHLLVDRTPLPHLHLHLHLRPHPRPLPSAYMLLPPRSLNPATQRCDELLERPSPQIHLLNPSANRGRKKLPALGTPRRWRRPLWHQLRWILILERHVLSLSSPRVN
jgi:hypothetical protein